MATQLLYPNIAARFQNPLPIATRFDTAGVGLITVDMRQAQQWLGLTDADGNHLMTTIWGYGVNGQAVSYPGPTLVAHQDEPVQIRWTNSLPSTGYILPVDLSLHMAEPAGPTIPQGAIPTVVHLHGENSEAEVDGHPEAWFTQGFGQTGDHYTAQIYGYGNHQPGATLWYHDHALGLTRLNVYMGLAAFYLLRDPTEEQLISNGVLPSGAFEIETAIQDRAFKADGQLYLPGASLDDPIPATGETLADILPSNYAGPLPAMVHDFFGDFLLVNGMAWPQLDVEPGQYRFRLLNGSDSRFYDLKLSDPNVKVTIVGTAQSLLPNAITIFDGDGVQEAHENLWLAPGDRIDLVFDFSKVPGQSVTLLNAGPAEQPFRGLNPDGSLRYDVIAATPEVSVGSVMRFDVAASAPLANATVTDGTPLFTAFEKLEEGDAVKTRQVGLFQGKDAFGREHMTLGVMGPTKDEDGNIVNYGPIHWHEPTTELPEIDTTEIWEIYNLTAVAHPVHLHQSAKFQVLEKRVIGLSFNADGVITTGVAGRDDYFLADEIPLRPEETGWQDTVWLGPGDMMRVIGAFDHLGEFVWHCHMLSHEDHEMMRPLEVVNEWAGLNVVNGTAGTNTLLGSAAVDVLNGLGADDVLNGGAAGDILNGGIGTDTATYQAAGLGVTANLDDAASNLGEAAGDEYDSIENLIGSAFADTLTGERHDNVVVGGGGADALDGGLGIDTASYAASPVGVTVNLLTNVNTGGDAQGDTLANIENLLGSAFVDTLTGNAADNVIDGGAGPNTLDGAAGSDLARIDLTAFAGALNFSLANPAAQQVLADGTSFVNFERIEFFAGSGADHLTGGALADLLAGGGGSDHLDGGAAADTAAFLAGSRSQYDVRTAQVGGALQTLVSHVGGGQADGADMMINIEALKFGEHVSTLAGAQLNRTANVDGDRFDDVLFRDPGNGQIFFARMIDGVFAGFGVASSPTGLGWTAVATGDVDPNAAGTGGAETFIQEQASGTIYYASLDSGAVTWGTVTAGLTSDWKLRAVADVNKDASVDAIVQNQATGTIYYADIQASGVPIWGAVTDFLTPDWVAVGAGDIKGDGSADVIVQQQSTGVTFYANMVDGAFAGWGVVTVGLTPDWKVRAVADVTGDGFADVIFQNLAGTGGVAAGTTRFADMANGTFTRWGAVATGIDASLVAQGAADVDNDGYSDVLFQDTDDGTTYYANMGPGGFEAWGSVVGAIGANWTVV